jgi:hypothetical protein
MDTADSIAKLPPPEIFVGEANPAEARFYARLPCGFDQRMQLAGTVFGPNCAYARTLPARVALVDQGPGSSLLAQAVVPDPCFWTPDLPFLYEVDVQLRGANRAAGVSIGRRTIGIRPLGIRGNRLVLDGRSWVLRGAWHSSVSDFPLPAWHHAAIAMVAPHPTDEQCSEASRVGVLLLADLHGPVDRLASELGRLSQQAAVGFAILPAETRFDNDPREFVGNLILVQRVAASPLRSIAPWAQAIICPANDPSAASAVAGTCRLPIIASRPQAAASTAQDARAACDRLQRDLAGRGDFAGYLV